MKKIILIITILYSINSHSNEITLNDIDLVKFNVFLTNLYTEIKCPSYPLIVRGKSGPSVCINTISYDLDKNILLYLYTTYSNNEFMKGFTKLGFKQRKKKMFELLNYLAKYTGVISRIEGSKFYRGKIQMTRISFVHDSSTINKEKIMRDFARDKGVVGVRFIDPKDVTMRYVAYLDINHKSHYKEGKMVSLLAFMKGMK